MAALRPASEDVREHEAVLGSWVCNRWPAVRFASIGCVIIAACGAPKLAHDADSFDVAPTAVELAPVWVGVPAHATVTVTNRSVTPLEGTASVGAPFVVTPATWTLGGGDSLTLDLALTASSEGRVDGTLTVSASGHDVAVAIGATVTTAVCRATDECAAAWFDPSVAICVMRPLPDGTTCAATNACVVGAQCLQGACVGASRSCDDSDPCTLDACDAARGCLHTPLTCPPPSDPCRVALCEHDGGCGSAPRADGVSCGSSDCAVSHVCISGQCAERPTPEGSQCGAASPCQAGGVCRSGACEQPPAHAMQPLWTYSVDAGAHMWSPLMPDGAGNLHWIECPQNPFCEHVSYTEDGVFRFRATLPGIISPGDPVLLSGGLLVAGSYTTVVATRLSDGQLMWRHDFRTELQSPTPYVPCPNTIPYLNSLADDGHGGLYAQFQSVACGASWNGSWTLGLDLQTGTTRWTRPMLTPAVVSCDALTGGAMVSDERGDVYEYAGVSPCVPASTMATMTARSWTGTTLWQNSVGRLTRPVAVLNGVVFDNDVSILDSADGGTLGTVQVPGYVWGIHALASPSGAYVLQGSLATTKVLLYRTDPRGALVWSRLLLSSGDAGTDVQLGDTPTLTSDDSLLFTSSANFGQPQATPVLAEVGSDGNYIFQCTLPGTGYEFYGESVLLPSGKWVAVHWQPWFRIEAYDASPLRPAMRGWVSPSGSPQHGNRPL